MQFRWCFTHLEHPKLPRQYAEQSSRCTRRRTARPPGRAVHAIAASSEPVYIVRLPSDPGSVAAAREHVEVLCRKFGLDAFGPVQVVSELAGNAVEHAGMYGGLEVWVSIDTGYLWIEVVDFAPEFVPQLDAIEEPDDDQERGRGLLIARMLAERIETLVMDDRKVLCACFPATP